MHKDQTLGDCDTQRTENASIPATDRAPARDALVPMALQWAVDAGVGSIDICLPTIDKTPLPLLVMATADEFCSHLLQGAQANGVSLDEADLVVTAQGFIAGMMGRLRQYELAGLVRLTDAGRTALRCTCVRDAHGTPTRDATCPVCANGGASQ